jgi:hypothetical protein
VFRASQFVAVGVLLLCCVVGCTPKRQGPPLADVKGTVTLDGQPMADGEVMFVVMGTHTAILPVTNGTFAGKAAVGTNRVEVYSYRMGGDVVEMGGQKFGGEKENVIPAQFNSMTTLGAQVDAGGANDFKFEVTSK